jgi:putative DNA methylase
MKKRYIEWDLPLADISNDSAKEKNIRKGHPSALHIWWARRPLASSRATILSSLIDLPGNENDKREISNILKKITSWDIVNKDNNYYLNRAKKLIEEQWENHPPRILDPFAGGGSIPIEAARLGCDTYSSDYNPVAVLLQMVILEWAQKFGFNIPNPKKKIGIDGEVEKINFLSYMVEKWTNRIFNDVEKEIGSFFKNKNENSIPIGYIWARTIQCQNPNCRAEIPLIRQFWLAKKNKIAYKPVFQGELKTNQEKKVNFEITKDVKNFNPEEGTVSRGNVKCLFCDQILKVKQVRKLGQIGKMDERMIAVVNYDFINNRKTFEIASEMDKELFKNSEELLFSKLDKWDGIESLLPDEEIVNLKGRMNVFIYGITKWEQLFNSRQKLILITIIEKIKEKYSEIIEDCSKIGNFEDKKDLNDAASAIVGCISLVLSRIPDTNSKGCHWDGSWEKTCTTFARQALPMNWDYIESNIFGIKGYTWKNILNNILSIINNSNFDNQSTHVIKSSATSLPYENDFFDAVFTDPPYYDNIPYANLSDFFYVWLKRAIGNYYPDLFSTPLTPKKNEIVYLSHLCDDYQDRTKEFFETELSKSFIEIHRVLKPEGISVIVYAHKTTEGWETMLNSLINSGLVVTASWPIHTELKSRLIASGSAALASSIYMVCRKTDREKVGFYSEIKPLIRERIEDKLQQFWKEGIAGGDFFISAIGPGMEIFSKYERVEKLSGEPVTTSELLEYIRTVSTNFIVDKLLKDSSSTKIDNESEFYLAYRWTYLDNEVEYDDARKLASASGVDLEKMWGTGGFIRKTGSKIFVLGPKERGSIDKPKNMIDVMHKALLLWEKGEKDKLSQLLSETGYSQDPAFKQFCQAIAESLLNGNKEKQLLEGFLIGIDLYTRSKPTTPKDQTDLKQFGGS